jgi:UDP-GlcNAc:undecaprenyl-phosphate/decaprenyl-phosphate GlcNAc-1-phosphate transferase
MTAATLVTAALVPGSRLLSARLGVMDAPGPRKIHARPMPRMGGVALFAGFNGSVWLGYFGSPLISQLPAVQGSFGSALALLQDAHRVEQKLLALFAGSTLAFLVGLADDLLGRRFPVWAKAAGQVAAALVLMASGVTTSFLPFDWMNDVLTLLWLVGITNAFNLLDNMDGLAAGVAFVASAVLLINAWSLGEFFISLLLVAFMGCLLGFLLFNFHPASVFLGDCGSLFIGYVLASLTLLERYVTHASSTLFPVLMPVMVCAVPLVDTATVMFIRIWERRPIYVGDARHLSHRLVSMGFHQRSAVLILYLLTFSLGLGAASLTRASVGQSFLVLLQSLGFVALILVLMFVERRRVKREPEP